MDIFKFIKKKKLEEAGLEKQLGEIRTQLKARKLELLGKRVVWTESRTVGFTRELLKGRLATIVEVELWNNTEINVKVSSFDWKGKRKVKPMCWEMKNFVPLSCFKAAES